MMILSVIQYATDRADSMLDSKLDRQESYFLKDSYNIGI